MTIQIKRDTAANWTAANPVLADGQQGYEKDTGRIKIGDGTTAWTALGYFGGAVEWAAVTGKPETFPPAAHSHAIADVTGLQTALDGKQAAGSYATEAQGALAATALQPGAQIPWVDVTGKPVLFSGSYADLTGIPSTFAPSAHSHAIADVTGLQAALDGKAGTSHTHDEATTSAAGFMSAGDKSKLDGVETGAQVNVSAFADVDLTGATPSIPPAGTVRMFRRQIAGRQLPGFIGPSGLDSALQPFLARNKVGYWCPPGNAATVPGVLGFTAPTVTGFTATARNVATTNRFTRMRRLGYVTAATAGAVGQWRHAAPQFTVGGPSGLGGFHYIVRFGISDAVLVADARMFMGVRVSATPSNVEPSALTWLLGMGHGAGHTTMSIYSGGSSAQAPIPLGADFPVSTNTDPYELAIFCPPGETVMHWQATNLRTGASQSGSISGGSTIMPTETTLIGPWGYRTNNATAAAVGLDVMSAYIETDF
jgi:hypothetical protein